MAKLITVKLRNKRMEVITAVTGEAVQIAGETFCAHRCVILDPITRKHKQRTTWQVTDPITGTHVCKPAARSKAAAIKDATERIAYHGPDKVAEARRVWGQRIAERERAIKGLPPLSFSEPAQQAA